MRKVLPLLFVFLSTSFTAPPAAQEQTVTQEQLLAAAEPFAKLNDLLCRCAEYAAPVVVHIRITQVRSVNPGRTSRTTKMQVEESGSGIIASISGKQVILTNRHVVEGMEPKNMQILTGKRQILSPVNIILNEDFDIAVIEIKETLPQSAAFGNSDQVRTGEFVLAAGNPFGLERSISLGIISAVQRRNVPNTGTAPPRVPFFQTDAAVNPGSSGGPLFNLRGEVIGMTTAIATQSGGNEGIAFAMPAKILLRIAKQLIETGTVMKPFIGFGFDPVFSLAERKNLGIDRLIGAKIKSLEPDGPAEKAGLKTGDVVIEFNGTEVEDDAHIVNLVAEIESEKSVPLKINRSGKIMNINVTPVLQLSR